MLTTTLNVKLGHLNVNGSSVLGLPGVVGCGGTPLPSGEHRIRQARSARTRSTAATLDRKIHVYTLQTALKAGKRSPAGLSLRGSQSWGLSLCGAVSARALVIVHYRNVKTRFRGG